MREDLTNSIKLFFSKRPGIAALFLFGSHAKQRPTASSDVDIAALYEPNMVPDSASALELQQKLSEYLHAEIDLVVMNRANPILKFQIFRDGQILADNDPRFRKRFLVKSLGEYDDLKRIRAPIEKSILKGRVYGG